MGLALYTAPTLEPVSVEDLKAHLRVTNDLEDTYIETLSVAARRIIETHLHRAILTQVWDYWLDSHQMPADDYLDIPLPPLASVTHIKSYSQNGTEATFSSAAYTVDTVSEPGRVCLNYGYVWPTSLRTRKALTVRFTAGWASDSVVPDPIKHGVKLFVARLFQNRMWDSGITALHMPEEVRQIISPWRIHRL